MCENSENHVALTDAFNFDNWSWKQMLPLSHTCPQFLSFVSLNSDVIGTKVLLHCSLPRQDHPSVNVSKPLTWEFYLRVPRVQQ